MSRRDTNIEIPLGLFKGILLTLFLLSAFMYVLGLRHGMSVQLPPTAVVEVTSEGRTDGK